MELKVNDSIRIVTDSNNYIVQESRIVEKDGSVTKAGTQQRAGDIIWDDLSYHGNLPDAERSLLHYGIKLCDDFNLVMEYVNKVEKMILAQKKKK